MACRPFRRLSPSSGRGTWRPCGDPTSSISCWRARWRAAGFFALLLVAYFQWCMSRGLAEIAAVLQTALRLGQGAAWDALGPAEPPPAAARAPEPQAQPRRELDSASPSASRPRLGFGRSIERRLFPNPGANAAQATIPRTRPSPAIRFVLCCRDGAGALPALQGAAELIPPVLSYSSCKLMLSCQ